MAELAAGAVSSLLGVIRNEALLLRGVRVDVQFIKEEMESMNSFLAHLARRAPAGGEHDEQVRTWMNQVRLLAQDCNNCIDLYLYRGNPDIHRAREGFRRYLWWVPWILHKLVAQHRAAVQLRQLKDRARDVGERRLRYGVEVPAAGQSPTASGLTAAAASSSLAKATSALAVAGGYTAGDDEEDREDQLVVATATDHSGPRAFFEPPTLDDYVKAKLLEWLHGVTPNAIETLSIAIVAPDTDQEVLALAHETLVGIGYHRSVLVDIPAVHLDFLPLQPKEILYYILRELEHPKSQSQEQGTHQIEGGEEDLDSWQDYNRKYCIYREKKRALHKIKKNIEAMKIYKKLDKIKNDIQDRQPKGDQLQLMLQLGREQKKGVDQLDLDVLLQLLLQSAAAASQQDQVKNRDMYKLPAWDDNIIGKIAKKLKEHMEADDKDEKLKREGEGEGEGGGAEEEEGGGAKGRGEAKGGGEEEGDENGGGGDNDDEDGGEGEGEDGDDYDDKDGQEGEGEGLEEEDDEEEEEDGGGGGGGRRQPTAPIRLHEAQYEQILRDVFPKTTSSKAQQEDRWAAMQATKTMTTTLGEEQIKQMIHEAKQEIVRELQESKSDKNQATGEPGVPGQNPGAYLEEIAQKIEEIKWGIKKQLKIKGIVDKIKHRLKSDCPLIILKVDEMMDGSRWEETRKALSLLECSADALIFTATESIQQAKGYCYPPREPIDYSLVGLYHYTVLELTSQQKNEDNYNPQIFRDILEECEPYEFCMKIFTHALHANPKRSNKELHKLHITLQASPKSFDIIAKKMFKFSYSDLPKEYKSCLLYLAIFPLGHKIRRSTLIGRWVAEGLIFKEDWPSSVHWANRCFDVLIDRWLVYPADIGATGKVKSCMVGDLVHGFITTIARKQHIVETRLSHHLARHFSIFNDLQLRSSDRIDIFFQRLSQSSRVSLLKVLDLEGCQCFGGKNRRYLKDICSKMLLLKYLSLKGTDITQLPSEINQLRELEVLDIRQTKVPAYATVNVLLLKLKRLLAGHIDPSPSNSETGRSVQIPLKIEKMVNLEVLSNVKARSSHDFKDIGKLWQLRMLGVVIDDKNSHLRCLLRTISDLHECLRSLSITLPTARCEGTPSSGELPDDIGSGLRLRHHPKLLESLSISGTTLKVHLLPFFAKDGSNKLAKVTLSSTSLNEDDMKVLAKLPKLRCVRLRRIACTESMLTFKKDEFKYLKYLLVEGSNLTDIIFEDGAARELEKMVLSFTSIGSISGVEMLPKLEELELNNSRGRLLSSFNNAQKIAKLTLRGTLLEQGDIQILAKKPNMHCLELLDKSCDVSKIIFEKDEFPKLKLLTVDCSAITEIVFTSRSAPKLEKIVWSFTYLSGIENLSRLKELEFNGDLVPKEVKEAIEKHKNNPNLKHVGPKNQDQAKGDEQEDDVNAAKFLSCWKKQV